MRYTLPAYVFCGFQIFSNDCILYLIEKASTEGGSRVKALEKMGPKANGKACQVLRVISLDGESLSRVCKSQDTALVENFAS